MLHSTPLDYIKITTVTPLNGYRLHLTFSNGASGELDLATFIEFRGALAPLSNPYFFRQVAIDHHGALCWPGDIDLSSNALYYATMRLPDPLAMPQPA